MKLAYYTHQYTMLRIQQAETLKEKQQLALNYFLHDAPLVDEELKKHIWKDEQNG